MAKKIVANCAISLQWSPHVKNPPSAFQCLSLKYKLLAEIKRYLRIASNIQSQNKPQKKEGKGNGILDLQKTAGKFSIYKFLKIHCKYKLGNLFSHSILYMKKQIMFNFLSLTYIVNCNIKQFLSILKQFPLHLFFADCRCVYGIQSNSAVYCILA